MRDINQLKWQCRRSMKELEILLTRYLEQRYEQVPAEQQTFEVLLNLPDIELYEYLIKQEMPTEAKMQTLVKKIRELKMEIR